MKRTDAQNRDQHRTLRLLRGRCSRSVAECVGRAFAGEQPPLAVWVEPDVVLPDSRVADGYPELRGLLRGWEGTDAHLIEARVFWQEHALHLVADGSGCRWVVFSVDGEGDVATTASLVADGADGGTGNTGEQTRLVRIAKQPVQLQADMHRWTGKSGMLGPTAALTRVDYWSDGQCLAWRIAQDDLPSPTGTRDELSVEEDGEHEQ